MTSWCHNSISTGNKNILGRWFSRISRKTQVSTLGYQEGKIWITLLLQTWNVNTGLIIIVTVTVCANILLPQMRCDVLPHVVKWPRLLGPLTQSVTGSRVFAPGWDDIFISWYQGVSGVNKHGLRSWVWCVIQHWLGWQCGDRPTNVATFRGRSEVRL